MAVAVEEELGEDEEARMMRGGEGEGSMSLLPPTPSSFADDPDEPFLLSDRDAKLEPLPVRRSLLLDRV